MVQKSGVDVDELLDLLVRNAAAELTTFYYYTILRANLIGLGGEGLKAIAETARTEDRNHFEALVPRIYELGGKLPEDMKVFHDVSACPPASLPKSPNDVRAILEVLVNAERCAVRGYTHICNIITGKDHRTYALALAIPNEEIEHESWFSEFLGEGPSGHFLRRGRPLPSYARSWPRCDHLDKRALKISGPSCVRIHAELPAGHCLTPQPTNPGLRSAPSQSTADESASERPGRRRQPARPAAAGSAIGRAAQLER